MRDILFFIESLRPLELLGGPLQFLASQRDIGFRLLYFLRVFAVDVLLDVLDCKLIVQLCPGDVTLRLVLRNGQVLASADEGRFGVIHRNLLLDQIIFEPAGVQLDEQVSFLHLRAFRDQVNQCGLALDFILQADLFE